jgi:hypothetical protein
MAAAHGIAHPSSDGRVNGSNRYSGTAALRMSPISSSPALQRHLVQLVDPDVSHARIDMAEPSILADQCLIAALRERQLTTRASRG